MNECKSVLIISYLLNLVRKRSMINQRIIFTVRTLNTSKMIHFSYDQSKLIEIQKCVNSCQIQSCACPQKITHISISVNSPVLGDEAKLKKNQLFIWGRKFAYIRFDCSNVENI